MPLHRKQLTYSERPNHAARAAHAKGDELFRTYDTSAILPKRSKAPAIVAVVLALAVVAVAAFLILRVVNPPVELLPEGQTAVITVEQGEGAYNVGQSLEEAKLVASVDKFVDRVRELDAEAALIPGTYQFAGGTSMDDLIAMLKAGPAVTGDILTVPEGLTREATADAVAQATGGRVSAEDFLAASADASAWAGRFPFLESAGSNSLEGFLFPKTYTVTAADDADAIVAMMLAQFQTETAGLSFAYPESQGLSLYDAVSLASIVEKEAAPENRATVASVFYNRLASDRPYLESDATTAYEVGHDPTADEVHASTPYSTYSNPGLPPTPICSPSLECLSAVCEPEQTNYLFFYFRPNAQGGMDYFFSETYDEHQQAIAGS